MEDFNRYASSQQKDDNPKSGFEDVVTKIASNFDGKSQNELLLAIYKEAQKGKRNGTLTNVDIDNFAAVLSPMLDEKKKNILKKLVVELKKI